MCVVIGCRHCGRAKVNRPRGLGRTCYYTDGVKDLYPSTGMYARRSPVPIGRTLPTPTAATPGSAEKIAVLEARAAAGELLFHPDDAAEFAPRRAGKSGGPTFCEQPKEFRLLLPRGSEAA